MTHFDSETHCPQGPCTSLVVSDQISVDHQQGWVEQLQLKERSVSLRYATSSLSVGTARVKPPGTPQPVFSDPRQDPVISSGHQTPGSREPSKDQRSMFAKPGSQPKIGKVDDVITLDPGYLFAKPCQKPWFGHGHSVVMGSMALHDPSIGWPETFLFVTDLRCTVVLRPSLGLCPAGCGQH